jgi:hypothetical protein
MTLAWFKSSYSDAEGGACVEVAVEWRRSSYSTTEGGQCVEVAACPGAIRVRDSKAPNAPHLRLSPATWSAFVSSR